MIKYIELQESNCKSCMRCVRVCPTKAMTYLDYQPVIVEEECIHCGQCYLVCPHSAKRIHSDLPTIKKWLEDKRKIIISVAPSFTTIWPSFPKLKQQLLDLGFYDVQETALGAKIVSEAYTELLLEKKMKNIISTCCPAIVSLIEKEFSELVNQLAPVVSPMIAHGRLIKKTDPDALVVFVTPCIAKQKEASDTRFNDAIDATIGMPELAGWLQGLPQNDLELKWEDFDGQIARIYPTPGGVLKTLSRELTDYKLVSAEGMDRVKRTLQSIASGQLEGYFFEMSACQESCIGGPLLGRFIHNEWLAQSVIREHVDINNKIKPNPISIDYSAQWINDEVKHKVHDEATIQDVLYMMGKTNINKELNCGCCGYETCREKAIAVLEGKADPKLCLPSALENAQSLSNLVIRNTPNGIIIVNKQFEIQEINPAAMHMLSLDHVNPLGFPIISVLPSSELERILNEPLKIQYFRFHYPQYNLLIEHAITYLEDNELFIIILMDLTVEEAKEKVIKAMQQKTIEVAQKVIDDQMRTVQEVASLLGETTAKSKVALTKLMKAINEDE